ncbi:MAG: hypothetical protein CVU30_11690 [Betaproteobacteria bacterium HGW-Betaproteobacteria-3]|nr:MAG: hypothetical protein CVU30_11690 [Betaproteobacteria bacterium HGW-Betaproteobacteria-3]
MVTASKKATQPATKTASPARRAPAAKARPAPAPAPAAKLAKVAVAPSVKAEKPKKPKLVRDSFTIPKAEYAVLDDLKLRSSLLAQPAKKSELLRAGIKALAAMSDTALAAALAAVPAIKTGRPKA